jgi:hypothetical protein
MSAAGIRLRSDVGSLYDERWLQTLIQAHPAVLPAGQIEPAMMSLEPVCTELPLPSGYLDNLLMTREGGLVLVSAGVRV